MNNVQTLNFFRATALAEGISTVLLFFVAMPMKYLAEMPLAVTYVGWVHGVLFLAYVLALGLATVRLGWSLKRALLFFLAAWVPLAPFWVERSLKGEPIANNR